MSTRSVRRSSGRVSLICRGPCLCAARRGGSDLSRGRDAVVAVLLRMDAWRSASLRRMSGSRNSCVVLAGRRGTRRSYRAAIRRACRPSAPRTARDASRMPSPATRARADRCCGVGGRRGRRALADRLRLQACLRRGRSRQRRAPDAPSGRGAGGDGRHDHRASVSACALTPTAGRRAPRCGGALHPTRLNRASWRTAWSSTHA
jgi:hypothetical protein